jgi:hypothetical protein
MARVVVQTTMSLDGFVAGPNHEMDWVFEHAADVPPRLVEESIASDSQPARRRDRSRLHVPLG